ncbi:MAG: hypothetical protein KGL10_08410 [Alphaproteobacteria bacterium]|nr:hypothetical protein [Alphaproteobacteria bacterium]MDE2337321.1 hypothetical protein [Alphaproteobacteria bacterium]
MLKNIFNRRADTVNGLRTTTVPDGRIRHSGWDDFGDYYNYVTTEHPLHIVIKGNKYGSYDIVRHIKGGLKDKLGQHLSQRQALNALISEQVRVMREYGGYNGKFTSVDLREHIKNGKFPRNHVFSYVQKRPEAVEHYLEDTFPDQYKKPAPQPAPEPMLRLPRQG